MNVYGCVCVLHAWAGGGWWGGGVFGKNECPVSWWAVWSGPGHLDNNGMKCSYCLKFTGRYAACTVWLQERDTKTGWVREMLKCEEGEGLERQGERRVHTVNRETSWLLLISGQMLLRLHWYRGLKAIVSEVRQKPSYSLVPELYY